jgi:thymidylate kinase
MSLDLPRAGRRRAVSSVALIGPDGSGKTTVAHALVDAFPDELRYLYMGTTPESTNVALPTTRLIAYLRSRRDRHRRSRGPASPVADGVRPHRPDNRRAVTAALRLAHWVADEWYRQIVSWGYQAQGLVVVYDRHFLFDAAPAEGASRRRVHELHYRLLSLFYPKPGLVILLEAPPEVLHGRKPEASAEYVGKRMSAFRREAERQKASVVTVDVTRSLDAVIETVVQTVRAHCGLTGPTHRASAGAAGPGRSSDP